MKTIMQKLVNQTQLNIALRVVIFFCTTLLMLFVCSCNQEVQDAKKINNSTKNSFIARDTLIEKMIKGDTIAYQKYMNDCFDFSFQDGLFWSIYFSDKYDYPLASYNVFTAFYKPLYNGKSLIQSLDSTTKKTAFKYLKRAIRRNDSYIVEMTDLGIDSVIFGNVE